MPRQARNLVVQASAKVVKADTPRHARLAEGPLETIQIMVANEK